MDDFHEKLSQSVERATTALLERRNPEGYWEGRLASSPLATAVALCALVYRIRATDPPPDVNRPKVSDALVRLPDCLPKILRAKKYLIETQNADGGWGDTEISKSNLA